MGAGLGLTVWSSTAVPPTGPEVAPGITRASRPGECWGSSRLRIFDPNDPVTALQKDSFNRITAGITRALEGQRPIKALLDPYNPNGSTAHFRFKPSRANRWTTGGTPPNNHVNWVVLDSDWDAEF